jgi:hypothetical protein
MYPATWLTSTAISWMATITASVAHRARTTGPGCRGSELTVRIWAVAALLAVLWALGAVHLEDLPWESNDFRVSGATVVVYLLWSSAEMRRRGGGQAPALPFAVFYAVLLVSSVDSFLLRLTAYDGPLVLRSAGVLAFAVGCAMRLRAIGRTDVRLLRIGRLLQLAGLPVALGSISGSAVAFLLGIPGSLREELPAQGAPEVDAPEE